MCIGVTIICLPPSVAISGFFCWYQGQHIVLSTHYHRSFIAADEVPDQSFKSYVMGLAALGGAYYVQSLAFPLIEGGTLAGRELKEHAMSSRHDDHYSSNNNNKKQFTVYNGSGKEGGPGKYMPPKDFWELAKRVAPPITLRVAASSMAFFCAGVVQTCIALGQQEQEQQSPSIRGRS